MVESKLDLLKKRLYDSKNLNLVEEATKQSFVIPFISYLGYDVLNPNEVLPEFKAGDNNSEAVDYALLYNKVPNIFIEVKRQNSNLFNHFDQLNKYVISNLNVNVGVLTNGLIYLFFTKSEDGKAMEKKPFYQLNISRLSKNQELFLKLFKETRFSNDYLNNNYGSVEKQGLLKEFERVLGESLLHKIFK